MSDHCTRDKKDGGEYVCGYAMNYESASGSCLLYGALSSVTPRGEGTRDLVCR